MGGSANYIVIKLSGKNSSTQIESCATTFKMEITSRMEKGNWWSTIVYCLVNVETKSNQLRSFFAMNAHFGFLAPSKETGLPGGAERRGSDFNSQKRKKWIKVIPTISFSSTQINYISVHFAWGIGDLDFRNSYSVGSVRIWFLCLTSLFFLMFLFPLFIVSVNKSD